MSLLSEKSLFTDLVRNRRSTRAFEDRKIPDETVVELMKAPLYSPSSKAKRPWEFVLVDDSFLLHQLSECKILGGSFVSKAPLVIVVGVDRDKSDTWIEDASVATTMLLLQAEALGLGACWVQVRLRGREDGTNASEIVREVLQIPENIEILAMVTVGYKKELRPPRTDDKLLWEKVHINKY